MSDEKKFFESMESDILNANIPEEEKSKLMKNLLNLKKQKINLMITGATGVGKSSTINALFNTEKAKVGVGTDPETMEITRYELETRIAKMQEWEELAAQATAEANAIKDSIKAEMQERNVEELPRRRR